LLKVQTERNDLKLECEIYKNQAHKIKQIKAERDSLLVKYCNLSTRDTLPAYNTPVVTFKDFAQLVWMIAHTEYAGILKSTLTHPCYNVMWQIINCDIQRDHFKHVMRASLDSFYINEFKNIAESIFSTGKVITFEPTYYTRLRSTSTPDDWEPYNYGFNRPGRVSRGPSTPSSNMLVNYDSQFNFESRYNPAPREISAPNYVLRPTFKFNANRQASGMPIISQMLNLILPIEIQYD
jgi:hypothetical protein